MFPVSSTTGSSAASASGANNNNLVSSATVASEKNMFLQLLVAQLKNQDPSQPMDSSTFVTQLAQFQQLEATANMQTDISGIHSDENQIVASLNPSSAASSTGANNNTGANGTTKTS
jgi:flagellar basal-body rod modification protein FlgD